MVGDMYKIELTKSQSKISDFTNTQLICSYYFLSSTGKYIYKRKLRNLSKKQKKAIIYDLSLFSRLKEKIYQLKSLTPEKWLENWPVYNGIISEIQKRNLAI